MRGIEVEDILKGDKIRAERLSAIAGSPVAIEYFAAFDKDRCNYADKHYLLERPIEVPTKAGVYRIKENFYVLDEEDGLWLDVRRTVWLSPTDMATINGIGDIKRLVEENI